MNNDPIVEEVRKARAAYADTHGNDLRSMTADLQNKEKRHQERLVSFPPTPSRKRKSA